MAKPKKSLAENMNESAISESPVTAFALGGRSRERELRSFHRGWTEAGILAQRAASCAGRDGEIRYFVLNAKRLIRVYAKDDGHVKGRTKRGWENGGKSFRKLEAAKAEAARKAAKAAK